jgi:hypothetical protein
VVRDEQVDAVLAVFSAMGLPNCRKGRQLPSFEFDIVHPQSSSSEQSGV